MQKEVIIFRDKTEKFNSQQGLEFLSFRINDNDDFISIDKNSKIISLNEIKHKKIRKLVYKNKEYNIVIENDFLEKHFVNAIDNADKLYNENHYLQKDVKKNNDLFRMFEKKYMDLNKKYNKLKSHWLIKLLIKLRIIKL